VLITDVRDVVFQADPFDSAVDDRMAVAMENPGIPIGKCPWTGPWVVTAYGEDVLERIGGGPMSCSGTTIAPVRPMMTYLRAMLDQIASMRSADAYLDQAAHNLLLHDGKIGPFERLENFRGPILTVGSEPRYRLDAQDRLVNRDGSVIADVHQYDRHPELVRIIERRIRPNPLRRLSARLRSRAAKRMQWLRARGYGRRPMDNAEPAGHADAAVSRSSPTM
jgi:hypothetical protein